MTLSFRHTRKNSTSAESSISARILESILANGAEQQASQIVLRVNHHDPPVGEGWLKWSVDWQIINTQTPLHDRSVSVHYLVDGEMLEQIRLPFEAYEGLASHVQAQRDEQGLHVKAGGGELVITPQP